MPEVVSPFLSAKMRFWSFASMLMLVFVHGYNLRESYLQPFTLPGEPLTTTGFVEYLLSNGLFRFRIPMLYMISGYLLAAGLAVRPRSYKVILLSRLRTLGMPYLLWAAIALGVTYLWEVPGGVWREAVAVFNGMGGPAVADYSWDLLLQRLTVRPVAYQLWFVRELLILVALYPLLMLALARRPWILLTILALPWLLAIEFPLIIVPEAFLAFSIGLLFGRRGAIPPLPPWGIAAPLWALYWVVACVAKTVLAFQFGYPYETWKVLPLLFLHKTAVVSGLIAAWYGADGLVRWAIAQRWVRWASGFSFFIYAGHVPLVNYATQLVALLHPLVWWQRGATYALLPTAIIALCIGAGALLRAVWPAGYSALTGGRGMGD